MSQIISRQETCKVVSKKQTLHEWMCYEAESVVQHNFSDVAVWDRKLVNKTNTGETRLWWIHAFGSQFLPMYCRVSEKAKAENSMYEFSAVEINLLRLFKEDQFSKIQNKIILETSKFFFITKGSDEFHYDITPTTFREAANLVFCGKANLFLT